jgi:hypothetical protein
MGFTTVPDRATGDILTEADWDTYIRDNFNTGVPVLLANSTLVGTTASIDLTGIAQDWAHLLVVAYLRGTTAATFTEIRARFNGDTGNNYDHQQVAGNAASATAGESFAGSSAVVGLIPAANATANVFGPLVIDIPFYSQATNNKAASTQYGWKGGTSTGNLQVASIAAFWRSSAAITQVTLLPAAGSLAAGSRATLYGLP